MQETTEAQEDWARFHRGNVFLLWLPRQVYNHLRKWVGLNEDSDYMRTPLWPSLVIALIPTVVVSLLTLIFQGVAGFRRTFLLQWWLGGFTFISLWDAEMINRKVLRTLLEDLKRPVDSEEDSKKCVDSKERLEKGVHSTEVWERAGPGGRRVQLVVGLIIATVLIPVEQLLLADIFPDTPLDWSLLALAFVTAALFGSGGYTSIVAAISFIQNIERYIEKGYMKLTFYCFDPRCSEDVTYLSDIYERSTICNAVTLLVLMLPLFFLKRTRLVTLLGLLFPLAGAGVLLGTFLLAQVKLSQLIMKEKQCILADLQRRIAALYYDENAPKDKERFTELQNLWWLRDRVKESSNMALGITASLRYLNSLVIPTISFVLINWDLLIGLFS